MEITAFAPPAEAHARVAYALTEIRKYIIPDANDEIRQEQMREMEILAANGGGDSISVAAAMAAAAAAAASSDPLKRAALMRQPGASAPTAQNLSSVLSQQQTQSLQAAAALRANAVLARVPGAASTMTAAAAAPAYLAAGAPLVRSGLCSQQPQKLYGDEILLDASGIAQDPGKEIR